MTSTATRRPGPLAQLAAILLVALGCSAAVALIACAIVATVEPVGAWITVTDLLGGRL